MFQELVCVPPVSESVISFATKLLDFRDPFVRTATALPPLEMSEDHLHHAQQILEEVPEFGSFRYTCCPRQVSDERFWSCYFTLLASEERFRRTTSKARSSSSQEGSLYYQSSSRSPLRCQSVSVAEQIRTVGSSWLSEVAGTLTSLVEDLDSEPGSSPAGEGGTHPGPHPHPSTPAKESSPEPLAQDGRSTFYVAVERPLRSSSSRVQHRTPHKPRQMDQEDSSSESGVTGPVNEVDDLGVTEGAEVSLLRLAPWWCSMVSTPLPGSSSAATPSNDDDDDGFEWYC